MTGWRLGWAIMPTSLAERVHLFMTHGAACKLLSHTSPIHPDTGTACNVDGARSHGVSRIRFTLGRFAMQRSAAPPLLPRCRPIPKGPCLTKRSPKKGGFAPPCGAPCGPPTQSLRFEPARLRGFKTTWAIPIVLDKLGEDSMWMGGMMTGVLCADRGVRCTDRRSDLLGRNARRVSRRAFDDLGGKRWIRGPLETAGW